MNKKTIWWIVGVVVVIVIIVIAVMMMGGPSSGTPNQVQSGNTGSQAMSEESLKALFASGASEQCAFSSQSATSSQVTGTVYVTAGHMRGDFAYQTSAGLMKSHMITDGTTSYVWTDTPAEGFKMAFNAAMSASSSQSHGGVDPNAQENYSCASWGVDQSEFTLPSNITFTDMSAMMNMGATATGTGMAADCSMCAQAGSAANQAACRAALHC